MGRNLSTGDAEFAAEFATLVDTRRGTANDVSADVSVILKSVKEEGDAAVVQLTAQFDRCDLAATGWRISAEQCDAALAALAPELRDALGLAADRIRTFHDGQRPADRDHTDKLGVRSGSRWTPVEAVGLYVPGGRAAYPSSVLMNAIPAQVAGVERIVMVTPTPDGQINPLVLAAAALVNVDEIYRIGGAQAIAALAFGTESLPRVDTIVGPGNSWVAEAKRQVFGTVGIDMIAGPSEILVIADDENDPDWIAADLLSQAEHDPASQSILLTDSSDFAAAVETAIEQQLPGLPTAQTARASWDAHGTIILVDNLQTAVSLANQLAPEHLELAVNDPEALFADVRNAGSVFLGRNTPEAVGDYVGGPNHVLPTGRRARFASGLSVPDFMKRTSFLGCSKSALEAIGPAAITLARAEGLPAHAVSIEKRLK
jgi:histidinol dehydrogenase